MRKTILLISSIILLFLIVIISSQISIARATVLRTALVVGNGAYESSPLKNAVNDAIDISSVLKEAGFMVTFLKNANQREMEQAIRIFGSNLKNSGIGLFYYAGHGVQVEGRNYLIPIDAEIDSEEDIKYVAVDAGRVLSHMEKAGNRMNILILDACRDNPFARSYRSSVRGLAVMDAPMGSLLAYSTSPGMVAADGKGRNGLYTSMLLKYIRAPNLPIEKIFKLVRNDVLKISNNRQRPWELSSLTGDFYFFKDNDTAMINKYKTDKNIQYYQKSQKVENNLSKENDQAFYNTKRKIGIIELINKKYGFIVISLEGNSIVNIGDDVFTIENGNKYKFTIKRLVGKKASAVPEDKTQSFDLGTIIYNR